jgi:hypothetical protein
VMVFEASLFPVPELPGHHLILRNPVGAETSERLERLLAS